TGTAQLAPAPSWLYTKIVVPRASKANPDPRPRRKLAANIGAICQTPPIAQRSCPGSGPVGKNTKPPPGAAATGASDADLASAAGSGEVDACSNESSMDAFARAAASSEAAPMKTVPFIQLL